MSLPFATIVRHFSGVSRQNVQESVLNTLPLVFSSFSSLQNRRRILSSSRVMRACVCVSPEVFVCEVGANAAAAAVPINPKANLRLADLLKKPALTSQESQGVPSFPCHPSKLRFIFQLGVRERVFLIFRPLRRRANL